ncbi:MAG TPA: sensor histidine kinase [Solirubrobacter sp.]|nr:sensor histidine kinase [Solirubrobacter sp.]
MQLRRVDPRVADAALAAAFIAAAVIDTLASAPGEALGDLAGVRNPAAPRWLTAALLLSAAFAIAWRRRAPLPVTFVVAAGLTVDAAFVSRTASFFSGYLLVIVMCYTLAAYAPRREALAGLAVAFCAFAAITFSVPQLRVWHDLLLNVACLAAAIGFGRVVRRLRGRTRTLTQQVEQHDAAVTLERARIARELHDVIAHSVSVMGVQAAAAEQVLARDPERAREPLRAIQEAARDSIEELRRLLGVLRDPQASAALVPQPGLADLDALVAQMRAAGLPVELRTEGVPGKLSPGVELSVYRVVQEALTNTLKHAGPVDTTVLLRHRRSSIEVLITDRGGARDGNGDGTGHGLIGMRERVALYGGTLTAAPVPGGGYAVRGTVPTA